MRVLIVLFLVFMLSGCVIYPARHVSEPSYEVSIVGAGISHVKLTSSLDAEDGTCEGGKMLEHAGSNNYVSDPEYGWIKAAFIVPIDAYIPIKICVTGDNNRMYYWAENIGVLGNDYPRVFKFKCEVASEKLDCEKVGT